MQSEAKFNLGAVLLAAGQRVQARKTWQDFLAAAADQPDERIAELLAKAKFSLTHTFGMPAPGTIGDLELGVAAAESFLAAYPQHELAAQAELEIAQGYSHHATSQPNDRPSQRADRESGLRRFGSIADCPAVAGQSLLVAA